ncbi:PREDICTED: uncharacterized protein LOC105131789 isoform X1 [Populus euphratica]|uniref:Uncharacterized protein LOC105131789 isoform X1 n=2 Tax=Populus euphratica TaxID=75702 RepID=A0AAJ6UNY4_POPEU|nr:PREDICTED: uncharacterized protein LOC105131789 isoform X1 [Populus euphratica]XP_011033240.1 PREDICTED: uncharacterized protein LOC105131789 isoform X1 [Populus euphratica]XP_011033241.1 PREDICTED: uncharacterized protein LOC105131789 isoform X1 [Populus euphratica]
MNHLRKLQILKRVSPNFVGRCRNPIWQVGSLCYIVENPRFYGTKTTVQNENLDRNLIGNDQSISKISDAARREAQASTALLEYLHSTRSFQFLDAEHMSKYSPVFVKNLLKKVNIDADIRRSITRYLRYHPINEFEIFFESMGLKPQEYSSLLPRDLMYLSDDDLLLENYHVMCNYGIARNKMGKIYKEATEVFRYDYGVLALKLKAYEKLGLSSSFIAKVVVRSPDLLIGDANIDFIKILELLRKGGLEYRRIEKLLSDKSTYNWSQLLSLLNLFGKAGYNDEQLSELITQKPWILREDSVDRALLLIGLLLKFGSTMNQICSLFLQFPKVQVEKFASNLRHCFLFLNEINMEAYEIGKLFRSRPIFIGSFTLKKTNSLLSRLNAGKKRICEVIQENPEIMKKWVKGSKIEWLPDSGEELRSQMLKTKFFLDLGFVENSDEMKRALKVFRGRGAELQERFDCLVIAGLDRKDVCEMIKVSPQILNQKKEVIETKIDFLINDLGFPVSSLVRFPSYLSYTMQRAKLRLTMYTWLKEQGKVNPMLSFSTIVGCTDNVFLSQYVDRHPRGPEIWEDLKKEICSA